MMRSAPEVVDHLQSRGVACALIGGVALAAHGTICLEHRARRKP
jgi:hypothetical protein